MSWLLVALLSSFVSGPPTDSMIVEFTTDNCGPCQQLQPALEKLKSEGWIVRTVNAAREPLMIKKFSVESVPTLVLISRGKEVDRIVGAAPYEKILPRLAKFILASNASQAPMVQASSSPSPQASRTGPAARAEQWPVGSAKQPVAPNSEMTVRGQSPASGAFPMLAAAASSALATAPSSESIAEKFNSPSNLLAGAATPAFTPPTDSFDRGISAPSENTSNPHAVVPASVTMPSQFPQPAAARLPEPMSASRTLPAGPSAVSSRTAPVSFEAAIARAEAATVRIRVDEENSTAYGTGTIVDVHGDEALVLTCGHLFREMKLHSQLTIDLFPGRAQPMNVEAKLIDFTANAGDVDIGLLIFKLPYAIEPVPLLPQRESLSVGQPAFSFGCDHGENPTRRDTQVKSVNRYLGAPNVEIAGAPAVGRSGGGLFDQQGRLIGVCNAADADGDEGIYAAAEVVYSQLNRLGLGHLFDAPNQIENTQPNSNQIATNQFAASTGPQPTALASFDQAALQAPPASSDSQITCIIRGANGQEQVVRVDSPSRDLLDAIYRQASGGNGR